MPHPLPSKGAGVRHPLRTVRGWAFEFDFFFVLSSLAVHPIFQFVLLGAEVFARNRRTSRLQFYLQCC